MQLNTQEWADAFQSFLNKNPNYKKSAETWEGALILIFKAENVRLQEDVRLYLDLWHGECRSARFLKNGEEIAHEYEIIAKEQTKNSISIEKMNLSKN
jgi:putative sterol carrier protein